MREQFHLGQTRAARPLFVPGNDAWNGTGAFARVAIPRGVQILEERALFDLQPIWTVRDITAALRGVTAQQQRDYHNLTPGGRRRRTNGYIFEVNNIEMREDDEPEEGPLVRYGIFLQASKFNHRCVPNAHMMFNRQLNAVTIYAVADIPANTESFVNYLVNHQLTFASTRRSELFDRYLFHCACDACNANQRAGELSNYRLVQLGDIEQMLWDRRTLSPGNFVKDASVLPAVSRFLELAIDQGLWGPLLANVFEDSARWWREKCESARNNPGEVSSSSGDYAKEEALRCAREALGWHYISSGRHSAATRKVLADLDLLGICSRLRDARLALYCVFERASESISS